ncbi:MAG: glucans biosynthesis glucosyltransferase MdoH [Verrucomicrobiales bacterium]|nr:glucans biosynthesis glucosyltransferase MdoH [Verrucomicrobiales bacterium]
MEPASTSPTSAGGLDIRPAPVPLRPPRRGWRVFLFFSSAVVLTGFVSMLFADLLWRTGWSASRTLLLSLFVVLFLQAAIGCMQGLYGFVLGIVGDRHRITRLRDYKYQSIAGTSTALLFPICNEDVPRVYEGLRATYLSLAETGELDKFDFFILSDSTDPQKWIEEERRWIELVRELNALGRIFYRRRFTNEGRKSGNIRDFLRLWGKRYRYFVVLDADSVMRGQTLVELVKLMEANPAVGLIQTLPGVVNATTLFGRIQQFANRFYTAMFIRGLNFWAQGFANYWGHNAIVRTEPFMQYCDLPQLPGRKPFGGHILSHDFVEAALLLRENWQVWFAYDLEGSYEEAPQDMISNARRDRRWCQGNLQHALVMFVRGLRGISRLHLLFGVMGYLAGPLWLLFLVTFNWIRLSHKFSGLSDISVQAFTPYLNLTATQHAFLVFMICMVVLLLPRCLALLELLWDPARRRAFGGLRRAAASVVAETIFSALHAPLQMLWHTSFVVGSLLGATVRWAGQRRSAGPVSWRDAFQRHWWHTLVGLIWGGLILWLDRPVFWWFTPVLAGMVLSVPLSVLVSQTSLGARARALGLFLTPEEIAPPAELAQLRARLDALPTDSLRTAIPDAWLAEAVLDPYVNAVHVSLLREKRLNPVYAAELEKLGVGKPEVRALGERLLCTGPTGLDTREKMLVLSDADVMAWLHRQAWLRPVESLAPWWQTALGRFAR